MGEFGNSEHDPVSKPSFYLHEVVKFLVGVKEELVLKFTGGLMAQGWHHGDLLDAFEGKFGSKSASLVTAVKVVKGNQATIAINTDQILPFYALYGVSTIGLSMHKINCYVSADSEEPDPKITKANIKWAHRDGNPDDVLISQGLANDLKVKNGQNIIIWGVDVDESDIDLDK